jgi:putative ABC transport system substrate-binding protein
LRQEQRAEIMRRRDFLTAAGGVAAVSPFRGFAQQAPKLPMIGFMGAATPTAWAPWTSAFVKRLDELGWADRRTIKVEYRWAEGSEERYAGIGAEFVKLDASVLVTVGGDSAKKATSKIPIVVALMADPVRTGLVASLARPGGRAHPSSYAFRASVVTFGSARARPTLAVWSLGRSQ